METSANRVSWYHFDALGNVIATSDTSGKIVSTQVYEPFGASRSFPSTKGMYGFIGEHGVESSGGELTHMGAREYDSATGRFMSKDPLVIIGSNPYSYASNNPVMANDPLGLATNYDPNKGKIIGEKCRGQDSSCYARLSQESQGIYLNRDPDVVHWKDGIGVGPANTKPENPNVYTCRSKCYREQAYSLALAATAVAVSTSFSAVAVVFSVGTYAAAGVTSRAIANLATSCGINLAANAGLPYLGGWAGEFVAEANLNVCLSTCK